MADRTIKPTSLDYNCTHGDYRAVWGDVRIRAVQDGDVGNPFEEEDGHWPISVRSSDGFTDYDADGQTSETRNPLNRFGDALLVHLQVNIAKILGTTVKAMMTDYEHTIDAEPVAYHRDGNDLRVVIENELSEVRDSELFDKLVELYELLGIPAYAKTVRGNCQGDWAEVLVVAPPEIVEKFGIDLIKLQMDAKAALTMPELGSDDLPAAIAKRVNAQWDEWLGDTADLYGHWAWGECYGYVIDRIEVDEDGDEIDAHECETLGSCWGYYGSDHDKSGLLESALAEAERFVTEPAPVMEDA